MKLKLAKLLRKAANRLDPDNPQFVNGMITIRGIGIAKIDPGMIVTNRKSRNVVTRHDPTRH